MVHTLDTQIWLPQPPEEVFPFFCDAFNLERITPDALRFRIVTPRPITMGVGTTIDYRLRLRGIPFSWQTLISDWRPPFGFDDEQVAGPFRRWVHRHRFVACEGGTLMIDRIDYALPLSPVSDILHPLIRNELLAIFRYRHAAIRELFQLDSDVGTTILIDARKPTGRDSNPDGEAWAVKLLYDGACPFCRKEVEWLQRWDKRNALALDDISATDFDAAKYGLTQATVDGTIHAIMPDGRIIKGMQVFRQIYAAVGLGWLLAPTGWPVLKPVFDAGYRWFARHRHRLARRTVSDCDVSTCRVTD